MRQGKWALRLLFGILLVGLVAGSTNWQASAGGTLASVPVATVGPPVERWRTQASADGWLLRFKPELTPGEQDQGSPTNVIVGERSDRVYVATPGGALLAFDRRTHQQTASAKVGHGVESLAVDEAGRRLYAVGVQWQSRAAQLSIFRTPGLELDRTVTIAESAWVRQILFDPNRQQLYALVMRPHPFVPTAELMVLDAGGSAVRTPIQMDSNPTAIALDVETGRIFTLTPDQQAQAATLRAYGQDGRIVGEVRLAMRAQALLLDQTHRRIYASGPHNASTGRLVAVDIDALTVLKTTVVAQQPMAIATDAHTGQVWVSAMSPMSANSSPLFEIVDPAAGVGVGRVDYNRPAAIHSGQCIAADSAVRQLWVANGDYSLSVIDLDTRRVLVTTFTGEVLSDVAVDEATGQVFALASNSDTLYAIEPTGGRVVARVPVGRKPISMHTDDRTGLVYILNQTGRSISVVDGRALRPIGEFPLAAVPTATGWGVDGTTERIYLLLGQEVVALSAANGHEIGRVDVNVPASQVGSRGAALTVDPTTHLVYVTGYQSAIVNGTTLKVVGSLPASPISLTIDHARGRAYGVNTCVTKSCGVRTYVYDLRDHSLLAHLEGVGEITALNPNLGHLYFAGHPAHVVDAYTFEKTRTEWIATHVAADAKRGRIYFLDANQRTLRAVSDRYPQSSPTVRNRYSAKIQIVWPHDGAPVSEANLANIGATIFQPSSFRPMGNDFSGAVWLWQAVNNEPALPISRGVKRIAGWSGGGPWQECTSPGYPVWDFNDVDVSQARDPANKVFFYLTVDGLPVSTNIWGHAADARTYFPRQDRPVGTAPVGHAVDTRIQIVWPHDGAGNEMPVSAATRANIGVHVYNHNSQTSVPADWDGVVRLYRTLNNGAEQLVGTGWQEIVSEGGLSWPRWVFDDVDVSAARDPANRYYFRAVVEDKTTYASVWSHGADGRTFFPQQDIAVGGCR